jgi:hypothetical protein
VFIGRGYQPRDLTRSLYQFLGRPIPAALKHT